MQTLKSLVGDVEEDGDEVFTPMPKFCVKFPCNQKQVPLENRDGFMVCSNCQCSYGHKN